MEYIIPALGIIVWLALILSTESGLLQAIGIIGIIAIAATLN